MISSNGARTLTAMTPSNSSTDVESRSERTTQAALLTRASRRPKWSTATLDNPLRRPRIAQILGDKYRAVAQLLLQLLATRSVSAVQHDARALLHTRLGNRLADPGRAAGDDHNLVLQHTIPRDL